MTTRRKRVPYKVFKTLITDLLHNRDSFNEREVNRSGVKMDHLTGLQTVCDYHKK